ncbi:hypothetical protein QQ054_33250 [Oscillatoria amoena NRMC-F 0135]|nr:hypothetical protein [Oscillatoria amoena NRMC-F 0135]
MSADKANFERELNLVKNIKNIAQDVLINESLAKEKHTPGIADDFRKAGKENYSLTGQVARTSIGKSAIIANLIAFTLKSPHNGINFISVANIIQSFELYSQAD